MSRVRNLMSVRLVLGNATMTMNNRILSIAAAGLLALAAAATVSCSSDRPQVAAAPEVVRNLQLLDVKQATVPDLVEAMGTVQASETAQLAAQIMGNVVAVNVREGDPVKRGQVLIVLDEAQPRAGLERAQAAMNAAGHEVAAAEAQYALAAATMKRYQDLFDKKSVSPQEFDEVKAKYQAASAQREVAQAGQSQAKAMLAQAQTMFDYTRIRAPFDGVVTAKHVDPGALASPGMPLLTVEKSGRFRLEATVDETSLRYIKLGQKAAVQIDALGNERIAGSLVQIVPAADPSSRTFVVKLELPANPQLRSGLFGRAYFEKGERQSLLVPRAAVVDRGQLQGVYVVGQSRIAELRYITLGKSYDGNVEVLSGLQAGDQLVASPGTQDLGGKKID